jgi:predicted NBD/HSP70 family sugar kinase
MVNMWNEIFEQPTVLEKCLNNTAVIQGDTQMSENRFKIALKVVPVLDPEFRPAILEYQAYLKVLQESGNPLPLKIALERNDHQVSTIEILTCKSDSELFDAGLYYIERLVKTLLWQKGGWKLIIGGSQKVGEYFQRAYAQGGSREFDSAFMSRIYEQPFTVVITDLDKVPVSHEISKPVGKHLNGCRIGLDLGGSDRKVSAVIDGNVLFSEEVIWHPKLQNNPDYHYQEILRALRTAASKMPQVDAIGVSAAGIYINNRVMAASLFNKIPADLFEKQVKDLFIKIQQQEMTNVPLAVVNDGDVTALAGAMDLNDTNVLGIAMGTSEAGGYIDSKGYITGWLNELAFVPVDFNPEAPVDEWAGDFGCGVKYFSQDAVIRLASKVGIAFEPQMSPAEKLKAVQNLMADGDLRAGQIFATIGVYLGYALAYYAMLYEIKHVLILGRVTSGEGGDIILAMAKKVLATEFPELHTQLNILLPDESSRRVGQSIAAASLPE